MHTTQKVYRLDRCESCFILHTNFPLGEDAHVYPLEYTPGVDKVERLGRYKIILYPAELVPQDEVYNNLVERLERWVAPRIANAYNTDSGDGSLF